VQGTSQAGVRHRTDAPAPGAHHGAMRPPITTIPGISADLSAIDKSVRAANDPGIEQVSEGEGGSASHLVTPLTKPPAKRP